MIDFIRKSLLAGIMIGLGCIIYTVCPNHYLGSFLFSLGLITVILKKYNLYTGKIGYVFKNTRFRPVFLKYPLMLLINIAGAVGICYLFTCTRINLTEIQQITGPKLGDNLISLFILAVGCGIMMYTAVEGYSKSNSLLTIILPIMFFILCGFEHCIADAGYLALARVSVDFDVILRVLVIVLGNSIGSWLIPLIEPKESAKASMLI